MRSFLQGAESAAQAESQVFGHPKADNHVRFLCAVSMLRHGGEAHADEAFLVEQLSKEIDVQRLDAVLEHHNPIPVAVFDLTDCAGHQFSIHARAS